MNAGRRPVSSAGAAPPEGRGKTKVQVKPEETRWLVLTIPASIPVGGSDSAAGQVTTDGDFIWTGVKGDATHWDFTVTPKVDQKQLSNAGIPARAFVASLQSAVANSALGGVHYLPRPYRIPASAVVALVIT